MKKNSLKKLVLVSLLLMGISLSTKVDASNQGPYIKDGSTVQIAKKNYDMWQNFSWKYKNYTYYLFDQTFQARGRYQHFNGATYYSLYDNKGTWYGYLNASATQKVNAQGNYISDGCYVQITKNYELWQNFNWKKKGNGASHYNKSVQARGRYQHFNGNTYYSLFDMNGAWLGYINANATTQYKPKQTDSTKVVNKDTNNKVINSTKGYTKVSERTDSGVTTTASNGDKHTVFTKTVTWKKDVPVQPTTPNPADYGGKYTSNDELILGESGGTHYSGVGNSGATFSSQRDAAMFALDTIADSGRGGTYTTSQVKFKDGTIAYTTSIFLK